MAAVYRGSMTIGESIGGMSVSLKALGDALSNLRLVAETQASLVADALATLDTALSAQMAASASVRASVRLKALADLEAQLEAATQIGAALQTNLTNPATYLQTLIAGVGQVSANISALIPDIAISGQITANAAIQADLTMKIAAMDAELAGFVAVEGAMQSAINVALSASASVSAALSLAANAVVGALTAYLNISAKISAPGAHVIVYDGPLASVGASLGAVLPSTGIAGSANVKLVSVIVEASNLSALIGLEAAFGV